MKLLRIDKLTSLTDKYKPVVLPPFLILVCWIVFENLFESSVSKSIDFLNIWPNNNLSIWRITFATGFVSSTIYSIYCIKNNVRFGLRIALINLVFALIYSHYRFYENPLWEYAPVIDALPSVKFSDCIYFVTVPVIITELSIQVSDIKNRILKQKAEKQVGFLTDNPSILSESDQSGRLNAAKHLANLMCSGRHNHSQSLAVAVNGRWGSGKTTFILTLQNILAQKGVLIFSFSPWLGANHTSITELFLDELGKFLSKIDKSLGNVLDTYLETIVRDSNNVIKVSSGLAGFTSSNSISASKKNVNNVLKKADKSIAVFIDDIDRLNSDEISQIIVLIRNIADFGNISFICAFDKEYVIDTLKLDEKNYKLKYLEKIFQFELELPPFPDNYLLDEFLKFQKSIFSDYAIQQFDDMQSEMLMYNSKKIAALINNPRDIVRFSNYYRYWGVKFELEVYFTDLFLSILLRMKNEKLFNALFNYSDEIFEQPFLATEYNRQIKLKASSNRNLKTYAVTDKMNTFGITDEHEQSAILDVLLLLFPDHESSARSKLRNSEFRINRFIGFNRYRLGINELGALSSFEFDTARSHGIDSLNKKIKYWVEEVKISPLELLEKFNNIKSYSSNEDYDCVIKSFIYTAGLVNKHNDQSWLLCFFNKLKFEYNHRTNILSFPKEQVYLFEILNLTKTVDDFIENFIFYLIESTLDSETEKLVLLTILENKLNRLLQDKGALTLDTFSLFRRIYNINRVPEKDRLQINQRNVESVKSYIINDLDWFLDFCTTWRNDEFSLRFGVDGWAKIIFGTIENFLQLVDKTKTEKANEFISFYKKLKREDMTDDDTMKIENFIAYDFNFIKPLGLSKGNQ